MSYKKIYNFFKLNFKVYAILINACKQKNLYLKNVHYKSKRRSQNSGLCATER